MMCEFLVVQLNSMWAFELICVSIFMLILCLVSGHKLSRLYLSWTCTYKSIVINLTLIDGTACQLFNLMNRLQGHNASRYDGCIQSSCKITSLLINSQYTSHNLLVRLSNGFVLYEWKNQYSCQFYLYSHKVWWWTGHWLMGWTLSHRYNKWKGSKDQGGNTVKRQSCCNITSFLVNIQYNTLYLICKSELWVFSVNFILASVLLVQPQSLVIHLTLINWAECLLQRQSMNRTQGGHTSLYYHNITNFLLNTQNRHTIDCAIYELLGLSVRLRRKRYICLFFSNLE